MYLTENELSLVWKMVNLKTCMVHVLNMSKIQFSGELI
jgi:hypothetical protein